MAAFVPVDDKLRANLGTALGPEQSVLVVTGGYTATAVAPFSPGIDEGCVEIFINYVKTGAAPSVVFALEGFDEGAQAWVALATLSALVATGVAYILVGYQVTAIAASTTVVATQRALRPKLRVSATHGNADVATYSITATANG